MELESPAAAYNVATGTAVSIRQVLEWILDEAGVRPEIIPDAARKRSGEIARVRGDATRLREETGWRPERDIESSVREVYQWIARRYECGPSAAKAVEESLHE